MTTNTNIITFDFNGGNPVRTITDSQGEPWFVAKDVCEILGIGNVSKAVAKLDNDEKQQLETNITSSNVGGRGTLIVNESGLYALILRCRDAMTEGSVPHRFRKWVTSEVLPAIRQTGGYLLTQEKLEEALLNPVEDEKGTRVVSAPG